MAGRKPTSLMNRFLEKIEINEENGCWEWTGCLNHAGYGLINVERRSRLSHRISWQIHKGTIPDGLHVLHACDNPKCNNPEHLFLGTNADNVEDKLSKGRHPKGELQKTAILKEHEVIAIKEILRRFPPATSGPCRGIVTFLARWFGVHIMTVHSIYKGRNWAHLCE